jgi:hypothetical protein
MAFRATCRRFHDILPPPTEKWLRNEMGMRIRDAKAVAQRRMRVEAIQEEWVQGWSDVERRAYSQVLVRARFRGLCEAEREGRLGSAVGKGEGGEWLVCCLCKDVHRRECFSEQDRVKDPEKRICFGSQGVLEVCPHLRVTLMALRVWGGKGDVLCSREHVRDGVKIGPREDVGTRQGRVRQGRGCGEVRLVQSEAGGRVGRVLIELRLLEMGGKRSDEDEEETQRLSKGRLERERIVTAVTKSAWRICPHIHTENANTWLPRTIPVPRKHSDNESSCSVRCGYGRWCCFVHGTIRPTYSCPTPNCDTNITLYKQSKPSKTPDGVTQDYLIMRIDRNLGKLNRADDKQWMAQIVEASKLEEDRFNWQQRPEPVEDTPHTLSEGGDRSVSSATASTEAWRQRQQTARGSGPFRLSRCMG